MLTGLVQNASKIYPMSGKLGSSRDTLAPIEDGSIGISEGEIAYVGPSTQLPKGSIGPNTWVLDAGGGIIGPGLVDAHTHLVFAGERANEFELRCLGHSYTEISRTGGGIASTVNATRVSSEDELVALARPRLEALLRQGVLHAEVKSGYGLSLEEELKILRAIARLNREQPVQLIPTLLCAHAIPEEHRTSREKYVAICAEEIIPAAGEAKLAKFCDVFVEESAFRPDEARRIAQAARKAGLGLKLHADQLSDGGGATLAAELGAISADHLEFTSSDGIEALAKAGVCATLLPTSSLFLRSKRYAPGRALVDAGVTVALGTNLNPGSAMTENVALTWGLGCLLNGLSSLESFWGLTRGGAKALNLPKAGRLEVGGPADLVVFSAKGLEHLPYHLAVDHTLAVIQGGSIRHKLPNPCAACSVFDPTSPRRSTRPW